MSQFIPVAFARNQANGFSTELRRRVKQYFQENNLPKQGDWRVHMKAVLWVAAYLVPYFLILTLDMPLWTAWLLTVVMGVSMAAVGLNTMHDANHQTFAKNNRLNKLAGATLALFGGSPLNWRIQHNVLHHTFTNIPHKDEDISAGGLFKFTPSEKTRWFHRYQHLYAPFLYALMTLAWTMHKDFRQLVDYHRMGLLHRQRTTFARELTNNILIKLFYYSYIAMVPLWLLDITWWQWLIGYLTMHFVSGLLLALIFQSAHVVEETDKPMPVEGKVEDEWMVHQLRTTANFATKSRFWNWFSGGLNFQVEHHLFPNISHIHYPKLSKIVKECAQEFGVPYHEAPTFARAVSSHFRTLKQLGRS
jgi:linoleoyl-CoA desaturase